MNERMSHAPRPKATFAEVQQFHKRLQSYLQQLHTYSSPNHAPPSSSSSSNVTPPPEMDVYDFITKQLKSEVNHFLLSFVPEASQYPAFADIYVKCTRIVMEFLTRLTNMYYKTLIFCINALLGFESSPYQSEIFVRGNYKRPTKQNNFQFVQYTLNTSSSRYPLPGHGHHPRGKSAFPESTISFCQLSVMDVFCSHMDFVVRAMENKHAQHKIGVFELQKLLTIFYQVGKHAKLEWIETYFYQQLLPTLSAWVNQLDDLSFAQAPIADDLAYFQRLFEIMEELVSAHVKTNPKLNRSPTLMDRDLVQLKLTFCHKLLQCKKMDRRVQALSLLKMVLERARSDDYKQSRGPLSQAQPPHHQQQQQQQWTVQRSKKQKQQQQRQQQQQSSNQEFTSPRVYCAQFLVQHSLLALLLSPTYLHENLLQRLQPLIDCLCETKLIDLKLLRALFEASRDRPSVELTHFNRIYLATSKQLPSPDFCVKFFSLIEARFAELRRANALDESHLEFVAQFTHHFVDKTKGFKFDGVEMLKSFAVDFTQPERLSLRQFAFNQLCELLRTKPCLKKEIPEFVFHVLKCVQSLVEVQRQADDTARLSRRSRGFCYAQSVTPMMPAMASQSAPAPDLTYLFEGIDSLLNMRQVGKLAERLYSDVATQVFNELKCEIHDLLVRELRFCYWNCSSLSWSPSSSSSSSAHVKNWRRDRASALKIRFDLLRTFALKTPYKLDAQHVKAINDIPLQNLGFLLPPSATPRGAVDEEFKAQIGEIYDAQKKLFLNECVPRNSRDKILKQQAIEAVFRDQFEEAMDMAGFRSWLGYFRELNEHVYDVSAQQYRLPKEVHLDESVLRGFKLMWNVMERNPDLLVVNAMLDEMIAVYHAHDIHWADIHVPRSIGLDHLMTRCNQVFGNYLKVMRNSSHSPAEELKVMRYLLLLRRIFEFSIGKKWQSEQDALFEKKQTFQIRFEKLEQSPLQMQQQHRQQRQQRQQQPQQRRVECLWVKVFGSRSIEHLRDQIAAKCETHARLVKLYRKYEGVHKDEMHRNVRYVAVEEHSLPFVTYQDLAVKERGNGMRIDLQTYILKSPQASQTLSNYPSCCDHYNNPDHCQVLRRLLGSDFNTVSLSAWYVLRYLQYIAPTRDAIPYSAFAPFRVTTNIYNIDVLRYYTDIDAMNRTETEQKNKVHRAMSEQKIYDKLLSILIDKQTYNKDVCAMTTLLWVNQLERILTTLMMKSFYGPHRIMYEFLDRSEVILQALMRALKRLFTCRVPSTQLTLFDVSAPKNSETTLSRCVGHCLDTAIYVVKNKEQYHARLKHNQRRDDIDRVDPQQLERVFIDGLRDLGDFSTFVLGADRASIKYAFFEGGLRKFLDFTGDAYVEDILSILSVLLRKQNVPYCKELMDLLMHLIAKNLAVTRPFVPLILQFVFMKLESSMAATKDDKALVALLDCAVKLYQHLRMLRSQKSRAPLVSVKDMQLHVRFLADKCLFGAPDTASRTYHKPTLLCASNTKSRQKAFDVLYALFEAHRCLHNVGLQKNPKQQNLLSAFLVALSENLNLSSGSGGVIEYGDVVAGADFPAAAENQVLKKENFVGMVNLGCTCYLNSVVQQLFMVPSFTNEVLSIHASSAHVAASECVSDTQLFCELQRVLLTLRESERKFLNPESFARKVRNFAGEAIDFMEQTDCQESLVALFHQLESNLKQLPQYASSKTTLLDDHFSCTLRNICRCEGGHVTRTDEQQMCLNIDVEQSSNLLDAFDKYTEASRLDGDNKYSCSACNEKVAATRRCTIYKPPKQLIVCLKRFKWNFDIGDRLKLNTRFEFDAQLDLKPYLNTNFGDDDDGNVGDGADDDDNKDDKMLYDLVGIVIHQGSAERGHYYSYIKDRTSASSDEWFEFNDKNVERREYGAIQKEAFGGAKDLKSDVANSSAASADNRQNSNPWNKPHVNRNASTQASLHQVMSDRNAYVLFYEQRAVKKQEQHKRSDGDGARPPWQQVPYLEDEYEKISLENRTIFRQQTLYDSNFVSFMRRVYEKMLPAWHGNGNGSGNDNDMATPSAVDLKVLMRFVYNVVPVQCHNHAEIKWWWSLLRDKLQQSKEQELELFITSPLVPSYLVNLFGKYRDSCNQQHALQFFEHVIALSVAHPNPALLETFLQQLASVVEQWVPYKLPRDASMQPIVRLINCVAERRPELLLTKTTATTTTTTTTQSLGVRIMRALIHLLSIDCLEAQSLNKQTTPAEMWHLLRATESNLAASHILDLLWRLMQIHDDFEFDVGSEQFEPFLHRVISAHAHPSQLSIVQYLVRRYCNTDNLRLFDDVVSIIHRRMAWLDFYEVFGALRVFNALLEDSSDALHMAKLQSGCLTRHVQKIMSNLQFWKLSQVCIVTLSELCRKNALVKGWLQENCSVELSELDLWCNKHKKFNAPKNPRNRNYRDRNQLNNNPYQANSFFRVEREFTEKDAHKKLTRWKQTMMQKVQLENDSLLIAIKEIQT